MYADVGIELKQVGKFLIIFAKESHFATARIVFQICYQIRSPFLVDATTLYASNYAANNEVVVEQLSIVVVVEHVGWRIYNIFHLEFIHIERVSSEIDAHDFFLFAKTLERRPRIDYFGQIGSSHLYGSAEVAKERNLLLVALFLHTLSIFREHLAARIANFCQSKKLFAFYA